MGPRERGASPGVGVTPEKRSRVRTENQSANAGPPQPRTAPSRHDAPGRVSGIRPRAAAPARPGSGEGPSRCCRQPGAAPPIPAVAEGQSPAVSEPPARRAPRRPQRDPPDAPAPPGPARGGSTTPSRRLRGAPWEWSVYDRVGGPRPRRCGHRGWRPRELRSKKNQREGVRPAQGKIRI